MPLYDFKCHDCGQISEKIVPSTVRVIACEKHDPLSMDGPFAPLHPAHRLLSAPASFKVPDMAVLTKKRQRIKEPIWRYPDGSFKPVNP